MIQIQASLLSFLFLLLLFLFSLSLLVLSTFLSSHEVLQLYTIYLEHHLKYIIVSTINTSDPVLLPLLAIQDVKTLTTDLNMTNSPSGSQLPSSANPNTWTATGNIDMQWP